MRQADNRGGLPGCQAAERRRVPVAPHKLVRLDRAAVNKWIIRIWHVLFSYLRPF